MVAAMRLCAAVDIGMTGVDLGNALRYEWRGLLTNLELRI
jgi:hypothetical protein